MADRSKVKTNFIAARIKELRKLKNMTQKQLAEHLHKSESAIRMWELGKSEPDIDTLRRIAKIFDVSLDNLIAENGSITSNRFLTPEYQALVKEVAKGVKSHVPTKIPVLGDVAAGLPIEVVTDILDYEEISPELTKDGSEYFALRIKGDSMEPKISDGDVVIVRKQEDVDSGQIAIVCVNGENATCKKVMKQSEGILLQPLNPSFTPTFYTTEDIETLPITILGRVVELRAKF